MYRVANEGNLTDAQVMGGVTPTGSFGGVMGGGGGGVVKGGGTRLGDENDPYQAQRQQALQRIAAQRAAMMHPGGPGAVAPTPGPQGYPGMNDQQAYIQSMLQGIPGRAAPQAAGGVLNPQIMAGMSPLAARQAGVMDHLQGQMMGQSSIAQMQGRNMLNQAVAQQRSLAAGAKPGQGAMALRQAGMNAGKLGTDIGAQTQQAMLAERNAAANSLGGLATAARGQDENLNMFNAGQGNDLNKFGAGLSQNNNQFNAGMQQNQTGLNDQMSLGLMGQQLGRDKLGVDNTLGNRQLDVQKELGVGGQQTQRDVANIYANANKPPNWERYVNMGLGGLLGAGQLASNLGWKPFGSGGGGGIGAGGWGSVIDGMPSGGGGGLNWGGAATGALGGAAAGSVFGPIGAGIGGLVGGIGGLF